MWGGRGNGVRPSPQVVTFAGGCALGEAKGKDGSKPSWECGRLRRNSNGGWEVLRVWGQCCCLLPPTRLCQGWCCCACVRPRGPKAGWAGPRDWLEYITFWVTHHRVLTWKKCSLCLRYGTIHRIFRKFLIFIAVLCQIIAENKKHRKYEIQAYICLFLRVLRYSFF